MLNKDITNEGLKIYKRIFCRHLKELGIYNIVKKDCFHQGHISFDLYVAGVCGDADILRDVVRTLWAPVKTATKNFVKSSILLLCVITDCEFKNVIKCNPKGQTYKYDIAIRTAVMTEFNYLFETSDGLFGGMKKEDALKLKEIIDLYGYKFSSYKKEEEFNFILNYG